MPKVTMEEFEQSKKMIYELIKYNKDCDVKDLIEVREDLKGLDERIEALEETIQLVRKLVYAMSKNDHHEVSNIVKEILING